MGLKTKRRLTEIEPIQAEEKQKEKSQLRIVHLSSYEGLLDDQISGLSRSSVSYRKMTVQYKRPAPGGGGEGAIQEQGGGKMKGRVRALG